MTDARPERPRGVRRLITGRPHWWVEVILVAAAYWLYAKVRDAHGRTDDRAVAFRHGDDVRQAESWLGLDFERDVQHFFLHARWVLKIMGGFYGGLHFLVTFGVLLYLLWRRPGAYRHWRRILGLATCTAVVIFALYPTAPPRLIPGTGLQDTLTTVGGLWSYNNGVLEHIADPYAAMPSLHLGWSTWVAASLAGTVGAGWPTRKRALFFLYPAMVFVIVIATGTHWTLDTFAGSAVLGLVWAAERAVTRLWAARQPHHARWARTPRMVPPASIDLVSGHPSAVPADRVLQPAAEPAVD